MEEVAPRPPLNRRMMLTLATAMLVGMATTFGASKVHEMLTESPHALLQPPHETGTSLATREEQVHRWLDAEQAYSAILIDKDFASLVEVARADAAAGKPYANFILGALHALESESSLQDSTTDEPEAQRTAIAHYTKAAEAGDFNAMLALAYRYERGYGVAKNCTKSAELYGKVAKATVDVAVDEPILPDARAMDIGDPERPFTLAEKTAGLLQYGEFQAAQGSGKFHLAVGYTYLFGILGQKQSGTKAESHFTQALGLGHTAAYGALGQLYAKGAVGVQKNTTAAFEYFLLGGREGDVSSLNGLATFFAKGITVERNVTRAVQYYKLAAFYGDPEAHYNLGIIHLDGMGGTVDVESAKHHLALASEKGMHLARYRLGTLYEGGIGVLQSCAKAVDLYKAVLREGPRERRAARAGALYTKGYARAALFGFLLSAETGHAQAEMNLGSMLEAGPRAAQGIAVESAKFATFRYCQRAGVQGVKAALNKVADMLYTEGHRTKKCAAGSASSCRFHNKLLALSPAKDLMAWAADYYRDAEIKRSAYAAYCLGWMHHFGSLSMQKNADLARMYYTNAMQYEPANWFFMKTLLALLRFRDWPVVWHARKSIEFVTNWQWSVRLTLRSLDVLLLITASTLYFLTRLRQRTATA